MAHFLKNLASVSFNTSQTLLFRSLTKASSFTNLVKMSSLSIDELKVKSGQASQLIEKLKNQIEQIKIASSPANMADRAKNLQKENEELKKKVENLKSQLESAESKSKYLQLGSLIDFNN